MPDEYEYSEQVPLNEEDLADAMDRNVEDAVQTVYDGFVQVVNTGNQRVVQEVSDKIDSFQSAGGRVSYDGTNGGVVSIVRFDDESRNFFQNVFSGIEGVISRSNQDILNEFDRRQTNEANAQLARSGNRSIARSDSGRSGFPALRNSEEYSVALAEAAREAGQEIDVQQMRQQIEIWEAQRQELQKQEQSRQKAISDIEHLAEITEAERWALVTLGEDIKGEVALARREAADRDEEQQKRDEEAAQKAEQAAIDQRNSQVRNVIDGGNGRGGVQEAITQVGNGDIGGALGSFATLLGSSESGTGLAGLFGDTAIGGGLSAVGSVIGKILPAIGIGTAVLGTIGTGLDVIQGAKDVALQQGLTGTDAWTAAPGMGLQAMFTGFTSGLSQKEVENIQQSLVKNRAEWGTEEYDQGFNFAMDAAQNRGIDGTKAVQYYTDMVVKGGDSMAVLNERMDALSETVQNTSMGMEEATKTIDAMKNGFASMTGITGGNQLEAEGLAFDMQSIFSDQEGATGFEGAVAQQLAGNIDWTAPLYANIYSSYVQQGYSDSESILMATTDIMESGLGSAVKNVGQNRMWTAPFYHGMAIRDYFGSQDWEGMREALNDLYRSKTLANGAVTWGQMVSFFKGSFGMDDSITNDPDKIVDVISTVFGRSGEIERGGPSFDSTEALDDVMSEGGASFADEIRSTDGTYTTSGQAVIQSLADAGVITASQRTGLTAEGSSILVNRVNDLYEQSGKTTSFSEWIEGSGRASIQSAVSTVQKSQEALSEGRQRGVDVNLVLELQDDAARIFKAKVDEANRQDGMDAGIDG